jgi:Family of unknown function (DUF6603)
MADPKFSLSFVEDSGTPEPFLTLPGGIGLYRTVAEILLEVTASKGLSADIQFRRCSFTLGSNGDSFLAELIPGQQSTKEFDIGIHWDARGVTFAGGAMLDLTIPISAKTPVIKLKALHIVIRPTVGGKTTVNVELSTDLAGSFGAIGVTLERVGIATDFYLDDPPAQTPFGHVRVPVGPITAEIGFKPPSGVGLSIDVAGVIKGGGLISYDPYKGRYAGSLAVTLFGIGASATIIINTKPDFSLVGILIGDFRPVGIDVGLGFTINAVGGLLGLHRGVDVVALRAGIRNNAVASLMFPPNPIEDGPRIINDLERMFPEVRDQLLVGPLIQLGWGKPTGMITLSLGVVIQLPDPNIVLIGIFRLLVPPVEKAEEYALLRLQVNFAAGMDFGKQMLWLEGALYDSRLVMYTLEGDMTGRLRFGSNANLAVTVGGFHPKYVPAADLEIPQMRRVAINLIPTSDNPRLRIEAYFAATSNTLQHGARLEAYASALAFTLHGFLEYNVIAQVSPLHIDATFGARVGIFLDDKRIMGLQLDLHVTGPSPWHVDGEVSVKYYILPSVTIPVKATFGSSDAPALPDVDVAPLFDEQLRNIRNWKAYTPPASETLVQLKPRLEFPAKAVFAHPSATIEFNQMLVPLDLKIQRFGAAKLRGAERFEVMALSANGTDFTNPVEVKSEFAPAQFFEMSEDDKLSAPDFRLLKSGLRADPKLLVRFGGVAKREVRYDEDLIDPNALPPGSAALQFAQPPTAAGFFAIIGLAGTAVAHSDLYVERMLSLPTGDEVKMSPGGYIIVDKMTMTSAKEGVLDNPIAATQALESMVSQNPALSGKLAIVPGYELA